MTDLWGPDENFCGKDVFRRSEISQKVIGDICSCVLLSDHDGECLCQHMMYESDVSIFSKDGYNAQD